MRVPRLLPPFAAVGWMLMVFFGVFPVHAPLSPECWAMSSLQELHVLERISANHRRVSLLDLVDVSTVPEDWRQAMSDVDVGEAPSGGAEKYIDPKNLRPFLCRFIESQGVASSRVKIHLPARIVIERKSIELSKDRIEAIFREFILANAPWSPEDLVVQRVTYSGLPVIPEGEVKHEIVAASRERFVGNVAVTIDFYLDQEKVRSLRVAGKVDLYQNVVHTNRPLRQNETITVEDLEIQRLNVADAPDRYVTQPELAVNKRLVRNVGMHQPLEVKDLDKALVLKKGDVVTIVCDEPGLRVTAKGQTQQAGSMGDTVKVQNIQSKKVVYCRVLDAQTVQATQ